MNCEHLFSLNNLFLNDVVPDDFRLNLVRNNVKVIGNADKYTIEFKEAFFIKEKKPLLNNGIKASKEFQLFCSIVHVILFDALNFKFLKDALIRNLLFTLNLDKYIKSYELKTKF